MNNDVTFQFYFKIFTQEDYDVERITNLLQIEPHYKWKKSEHMERENYRKNSLWTMKCEEVSSYNIAEPFEKFIISIKDKIPLIQNLAISDNLSCQVDVVVDINCGNTMPGININPQIMNLLSSMNCSLDIDIYDNRE